jgi:hypothetical protein
MNGQGLERHQQLAAVSLQSPAFDLTAKHLALGELRSICRSDPTSLFPETVGVLGQVLQNADLARHTQAYFLYKEAAGCLYQLATRLCHCSLGRLALTALTEGLSTRGPSQRAAAESLGSMPISIRGPSVPRPPVAATPVLPLDSAVAEIGFRTWGRPQWIGRSMVFRLECERRVLVFKTTPSRSGREALIREISWLDYLGGQADSFPVRFEIPEPVRIGSSPVFLLKDFPVQARQTADTSPGVYAVAFLAHPDYFTYPNNSGNHKPLDDLGATKAMFRNAFLLGHLSAAGIVHEAPIPLFHNRVQRHRREDHGRYQWHRAGRLDRWLSSCAFPNLGLTGIRDFEHLLSFSGPSRGLYTHLGTHFLSLLLVAGSYFRNKDKARVGLDGAGGPADARELFDAPLLHHMVEGIFHHYYHGFVGQPFHAILPFDPERLVLRMIEEMGRDQHMEEVLRAADQLEMSEAQFRELLHTHSFNRAETAVLKRGMGDIVLHTGPHLGGFNQGISMPELIEAVGAMSALCIQGRFGMENTGARGIPDGPVPDLH